MLQWIISGSEVILVTKLECSLQQYVHKTVALFFVGFSIGPFEWYRFETLPLFFTQLISAYEGIGCVSSMYSLCSQFF